MMDLVRDWKPPPQVSEQALHAVHDSESTQLTGTLMQEIEPA
jgi:hypothetical protein